MIRRRTIVAVLSAVGLALFAGCKPSPAPSVADIPSFDDPTAGPFFREVTDSGIDFTYRNGEEADHMSILESLGGGVALLDYDGDGKLDVFVTGGGGYAGPDGKTIVGKPCKLYRNLGGFKFQDVTKEAGLEDFPWDAFYTHGAAVADYDRDGWPDLLVTGWGRVVLFHNEPVDPHDPAKGRKFVEVKDSGLTDITWGTSAAWADFDGDGYPDVYICQYVDWSWKNDPQPCTYDSHTRDVCPPKAFSGLPHKLFANVDDGKGGRRFKDVSAEAGLKPGGPEASKGLGVLAVDVNGDGKPDIYVCNDTVDNFLYINHCSPGHFRFEEVGVKSGSARDDRGQANGSMGVDAADYDGCGRPSIWVTNYEDEKHALYHNDCVGDAVLFNHRTSPAGISALGQKYVAWGTAFLDLDHDGWEDVFIADGHAIHFPTKPGSSRRQKPVLLRNQGDGKFKNLTAQGGPYFEKDHLSRGVAFGDLDDDGRIDAIVSQLNDPVSVLQNVAKVDGRHWLGVELIGKDHADVVGATVRLEAGGRTQSRFAKGGGSYASSSDRRSVFGLGAADHIGKITVTWPNREEQTFDGGALPVDRYYRIFQGKVEPQPPGGKP